MFQQNKEIDLLKLSGLFRTNEFMVICKRIIKEGEIEREPVSDSTTQFITQSHQKSEDDLKSALGIGGN